MLTLLPIKWTRPGSANAPREPIAYEVAGLLADRRVVIRMAPGGWRLVNELFTEALAALKAAVQEAERPPTF